MMKGEIEKNTMTTETLIAIIEEIETVIVKEIEIEDAHHATIQKNMINTVVVAKTMTEIVD